MPVNCLRRLAPIALCLAAALPAQAESGAEPLRRQALELAPAALGLTPMTYPHSVWGVYVEIGGEDARATLLVLGDGSVRVVHQRGETVTEAGGDADTSAAAKRLLVVANTLAEASSPAGVEPPAGPGETRVELLTYRGRRVADATPELVRAGEAVLAAAERLRD